MPEFINVSNVGGVAVVGFVLWLIWRQYRADRKGEDAQTDAAAITLIKAMGAERSSERQETRAEINGLRERLAIVEDRERRHADVLTRHSTWDAKVMAILQQSAESAVLTGLGDPPPLYPPGG